MSRLEQVQTGHDPAASTAIAIVTGLAAEAKILRRQVKKTEIEITCAASDPDRARLFITRLIANGARRCLSFGLAGGLAPDLPAGSIVLASHVIMPAARWEADAAWLRRLTAALPAAHVGGIWGGDQIAATPAAKSNAYSISHCLACDMESHIVAAAAHAAGLSFAALRVVCDPAAFALPPAALLPLRDDGAPDLPAILRAIARQPAQLPALLQLAGHNRRAMRALAVAASILA